MLKNSTQIVKSPKVIEVPDEEGIPEVITLSQIQHIQKFLKVSTEVKVLVQKREPIYVSTGKMKQDVIVADHTSTMKVNLWEDYVDFMEDKSYGSISPYGPFQEMFTLMFVSTTTELN